MTIADTTTTFEMASPQLATAPQPVAAGTAPAPVRVVWVAGRKTLRRFSRILQPLAIGLMDEMVQLVLVTPPGVDPDDVPTAAETVEFAPTRWPVVGRRRVEALAEQLGPRKPHLVHALDVDAWTTARRLAERLGKPAVVSTHAAEDAGRLRRGPARMAAVLASTAPVRQAVNAANLTPAGSVHLLRPGVIRTKHATCFPDPNQSISILSAGALSRPEPWRAVLRAFADVRQARQDCVFFIVGGGPAARTLRGEAHKLGLRGDLTFADTLTTRQMAGIFKAADVFVAPVGEQRLDVYALLALAAGMPVLAAEGGISDFLLPDRTVWAFPQGDAEALSDGLTRALTDKAAARQLAESALEYLGQHHGPADMVHRLTAIYRDVTE